MHRKIINLALPSIVSNITVPLLGLVDTAITGHMGEARYIGAIAVGSMLFNIMYWLFAFLRMGTGGMTAQAYGRKDFDEADLTGLRAICISSLIGLAIIVLQYPLLHLAMWFIAPDENITQLVYSYCYICIWGAPASLGLFALNGWFVGMQNTKIPMIISITQNVVNILTSLLLVYWLGMKIDGVASGTLIAQWAGFFMGSFFFLKKRREIPSDGNSRVSLSCIFEPSAMKSFFTVNRDIFLRTLFLVSVNLYFVVAGAKGGEIILAVNTLLMQLFILYSYIMDGFAYAAEALCGRFYGAGDNASLKETIRKVFYWSIGLTAIYSIVYGFGGLDFLRLLTNEESVISASEEYIFWAILIPISGMVAFVWDGVFIGMTMTKGMLSGTFVAAIVFFITNFSLESTLHNHALWLAFILYLAARGVTQSVYWHMKKIKV
jgi:MATE family multidrug resistance protein